MVYILASHWPWEVYHPLFIDNTVLRFSKLFQKVRYSAKELAILLLWARCSLVGGGCLAGSSHPYRKQGQHRKGRTCPLEGTRRKPYHSVVHLVHCPFLSCTMTSCFLNMRLVLIIIHRILCWSTVELPVFLSALWFWLSNAHSRAVGT